ncbi:hypothetical protein V6N12_011549 [Hibiscus sabdariffa]|uniref:Uncharacterized protein n=1 Tax=Hibiscus sabdariffa TaxID=183260 RepID=A0ABR2AYT3_9ROSI
MTLISRIVGGLLATHNVVVEDLCIDFEEIEEDGELKTEYPCPYCSEDFDLLGLCCHIDDEHHLEAGYGVCPVCALRVEMNMVDHITTQHGNVFKSNHRIKLHKGDSYSTLSSLRKELHDSQYQYFLKLHKGDSYSTISSLRKELHDSQYQYFLKLHKGDSYSTLSSLRKELHDSQYQYFLSKSWSSLSSSNIALHSLLSFLSCPPPADSSESVKSATSSEATLEDNGSNENMLEKDVQPSPLSDKEHLEKSKRAQQSYDSCNFHGFEVLVHNLRLLVHLSGNLSSHPPPPRVSNRRLRLRVQITPIVFEGTCGDSSTSSNSSSPKTDAVGDRELLASCQGFTNWTLFCGSKH